MSSLSAHLTLKSLHRPHSHDDDVFYLFLQKQKSKVYTVLTLKPTLHSLPAPATYPSSIVSPIVLTPFVNVSRRLPLGQHETLDINVTSSKYMRPEERPRKGVIPGALRGPAHAIDEQAQPTPSILLYYYSVLKVYRVKQYAKSERW